MTRWDVLLLKSGQEGRPFSMTDSWEVSSEGHAREKILLKGWDENVIQSRAYSFSV
tara:strand:- start:28 stop:195 length:168 start_codon:yes stop_codon:yes gene_type:complete